MSNSPMLPGNSTPLERAAAQAMADIQRVPITIRDLWNPDTCPLHLLPYLAWAFSVDRWDSDWPEAVQRAAIRDSFLIHRRKGTIAALKRIVEPLGLVLGVTEWWQMDPPGPPGTFSLQITLNDDGITEEVFYEVERLLNDAKPVSRHIVGLSLRKDVSGPVRIAAFTNAGIKTTVYPLSE